MDTNNNNIKKDNEIRLNVEGLKDGSSTDSLCQSFDEDDRLIKAFFNETAKPIEDKGFTRKVILHLPDTIYKIGIVLEVIGSMAALYMIVSLIGVENIGHVGQLFHVIRTF